MALDNQDLKSLVDKVCLFISDRIVLANRTGELESYLQKIGFCDEIETNHNNWVFNPNTVKILIIGYSQIDKKTIDRIATQTGIDSRQVELVTNEDIKRFSYAKIRNNFNYSDIIFGPIHHKGKGVDGSSSPISMVEANPSEYPHMVKATVNGELKITKESLRRAFNQTVKVRSLLEI